MVTRVRGSKGFTLMETVVGVFIMGLVVIGVSATISNTLKSMQSTNANNQLTNDSRIAINSITATLQRAVPNTTLISQCGSYPCTATCVPPAGISPSSCIQFNTLDDISNSTFTTSVALSTYTYYLAYPGNTLNMQAQLASVGGGSHPLSSVLASNVTTLQFVGQSIDPTVMGVTLGMSIPNGPNGSQSVYLPNVMVQMGGGVQ